MLDRSGFGITLVDRRSEGEDSGDPQQLVAEILTDSVAYLRPGTYSDTELNAIGTRLAEFTSAGIKTLVLDLRARASVATFQGAARFLDQFCLADELLFKIQKPGEASPSLFLSQSDTSWPATSSY